MLITCHPTSVGSDGPGSNAATGDNRSAAKQVDLTRPDAYGRAFADIYDRWYGTEWSASPSGPDDERGSGAGPAGTIGAMVDFVVERCPSGIVLELGAGSGRLAVPLTEAGLVVIGLDASVAMLRRCPPAVLRVAGDMAHLPLRSPLFDRAPVGPTVLCGFNTLFNLGSVDSLDRLLASVAWLEATFIVEMMNVELLADEPVTSTGVAPFAVESGLVVSSSSSDAANRLLTGRHLEITDGGVVSRPWMLRLVDRHELDEAAERHGMAVVERFRSWQAGPFTDEDSTVISVYRPVSATGPNR